MCPASGGFCGLTSGMLPTLGCTEAACYNALRSTHEDSVTQGSRHKVIVKIL
jgi:hypothetical protein